MFRDSKVEAARRKLPAARFWFCAWAVIVASIWAGSYAYGRWEEQMRRTLVATVGASWPAAAPAETALGGDDGRTFLWRGVFGSILWTGAALAMALATGEGRRRIGEEGNANAVR